jgi:hypothetical protein
MAKSFGEIFNQCNDVVSRERQAVYGPPTPSMECFNTFAMIAGQFSQIAGATGHTSGHNGAMMMVFLKLARIVTSRQFHEDSYLDAINYLAIALKSELDAMETPINENAEEQVESESDSSESVQSEGGSDYSSI